MARKISRKETTGKRHTTLPPQAKVESSKVTAAAPVTKSVAVKAPVAIAPVAIAPVVEAKVAAPAATVVKDAELKCTAHTAVAEKTEAACATRTAVVAEPEVELTAHAAVATPATTDDTICCKSNAQSLLSALGDADADVAREAATGLGLLGDVSAVQPLIDVLNSVDGYYHTVVRAAAAGSLGQLGDGRAVQPLLDAVYDSTAEVSVEAIHALATLGDSRAVDALIVVVRNPTGYFLATARRAAVTALAKLGGEQAIAELRWVAADSWEDSVIREAAEAATQEVAIANA